MHKHKLKLCQNLGLIMFAYLGLYQSKERKKLSFNKMTYSNFRNADFTILLEIDPWNVFLTTFLLIFIILTLGI